MPDEYKKHSNSVEAFDESGKSLGIVFQTTSAFDTPYEMQNLISWTNQTLEDKSYHPLIMAGVFNVVFLVIHPFQDGNGRLSRILATLLMLKAGYNYIPYSSLESIIEKTKKIITLPYKERKKHSIKDKADWIPWLNFFFSSLKRQKDYLEKKTAQLSQFTNLPYECTLIMQYVDIHQRITIV